MYHNLLSKPQVCLNRRVNCPKVTVLNVLPREKYFFPIYLQFKNDTLRACTFHRQYSLFLFTSRRVRVRYTESESSLCGAPGNAVRKLGEVYVPVREKVQKEERI